MQDGSDGEVCTSGAGVQGPESGDNTGVACEQCGAAVPSGRGISVQSRRRTVIRGVVVRHRGDVFCTYGCMFAWATRQAANQ